MCKKQYIFFLIFISLFINGCSSKQKNYPEFRSASLEKMLLEKSNSKDKLNNFYANWKGVKYKYGGNSKRGIDCSAFTQKAYKSSFNIQIPRTTTLQAKIGKTIKKSQLKRGDLIFFKTGIKSKHVGIYMEKGKFLHASSSKGVTFSRLDNTYFSKHYWKSKRVID